MQEVVDMENFPLHVHMQALSVHMHIWKRVGCEMDRNMFMHSLAQFLFHNVSVAK